MCMCVHVCRPACSRRLRATCFGTSTGCTKHLLRPHGPLRCPGVGTFTMCPLRPCSAVHVHHTTTCSTSAAPVTRMWPVCSPLHDRCRTTSSTLTPPVLRMRPVCSPLHDHWQTTSSTLTPPVLRMRPVCSPLHDPWQTTSSTLKPPATPPTPLTPARVPRTSRLTRPACPPPGFVCIRLGAKHIETKGHRRHEHKTT